MAKCATCGTEVSFFNLERECDSCLEIRMDQLRAKQIARGVLKKTPQNAELFENTMRREVERAEQAEHAELSKNTWIEQQVAEFTVKLSNDVPIYLFQRIYCPVDSRVHDEDLADGFYLEDMEELGADGWQIVGIVPRTIGIGLKNTSYGNTSGITWGAGMGGNVAGVYVLLQLNVTLANVNRLTPTIKGYFGTKYHAPN
jgi:hypothetical protein